MKPKHHLWVHITEDMALEGNPRHFARYCDESSNRDFARIAQSCHRKTFERRLFAKYSTFLETVTQLQYLHGGDRKNKPSHNTRAVHCQRMYTWTRERKLAISRHCWRRDKTHCRCCIRFLDVTLETLRQVFLCLKRPRLPVMLPIATDLHVSTLERQGVLCVG